MRLRKCHDTEGHVGSRAPCSAHVRSTTAHVSRDGSCTPDAAMHTWHVLLSAAAMLLGAAAICSLHTAGCACSNAARQSRPLPPASVPGLFTLTCHIALAGVHAKSHCCCCCCKCTSCCKSTRMCALLLACLLQCIMRNQCHHASHLHCSVSMQMCCLELQCVHVAHTNSGTVCRPAMLHTARALQMPRGRQVCMCVTLCCKGAACVVVSMCCSCMALSLSM